ncbi:MAG: thiol peroxidase [Candidatus Omnitrophica bacterium]|nr:thiol peroxidase [Candidatus Omnitrophota bacterium]
MERFSKVKGNPVTLVGRELKTGDKAPGFKVLDAGLKDIAGSEFGGRLRLIASVPSLDTPVCDLEIKRFNEEAVKLSNEIEIIFISCDLPFAQKRFCQAHGIKQVKTFSDHRDVEFGKNYGVLIKELRLLSRAIFIIGKDDRIKYVEYVDELTSQPHYDKALEELRKAKV